MCDWNETADLLCGLAFGAVQPHLAKLNTYYEGIQNKGIENWFQVELVVVLRQRGYEVEKQKRGLPDIKISQIGNKGSSILIELKAGSYCRPDCRQFIKRDLVYGAKHYKDTNDARFLGCLFLGRFDSIQYLSQKFHENQCDLISIQYAGPGSNGTCWRIGVVRCRRSYLINADSL